MVLVHTVKYGYRYLLTLPTVPSVLVSRKPNVLIDMKAVRSLAMPLLSSKARVHNLCKFQVPYAPLILRIYIPTVPTYLPKYFAYIVGTYLCFLLKNLFLQPKERRGIPLLCARLGQTNVQKQDWLVLSTKPRPKPTRSNHTQIK